MDCRGPVYRVYDKNATTNRLRLLLVQDFDETNWTRKISLFAACQLHQGARLMRRVPRRVAAMEKRWLAIGVFCPNQAWKCPSRLCGIYPWCMGCMGSMGPPMHDVYYYVPNVLSPFVEACENDSVSAFACPPRRPEISNAQPPPSRDGYLCEPIYANTPTSISKTPSHPARTGRSCRRARRRTAHRPS